MIEFGTCWNHTAGRGEASITVKCNECGDSFTVPHKRDMHGIPTKTGKLTRIDARTLAVGIQLRGWKSDTNGKHCMCKRCLEIRKAKMAQTNVKEFNELPEDEQVQAMGRKTVASQQPAPLALPPSNVPVVDGPLYTVQPPTPSQRRAIFDTLSEVYDVDKGMYRKDWTDPKIGTKHSLPHVHVALIREQFFGMGASNESASKVNVVTAQLVKEIQDIKDGFYRAFETFERHLSKVEADLDALRKGAK